MGDAEMQSSDREGDLFPGPEKEQAGAGGDPQDLSTSEDQFEDLTQDVTQGPPPPKKSESRAGSDVDEVSSQDVVQSRESKHKESESGAGSDVDGVSNQDVMQSRESKPRESGSSVDLDVDEMSNEDIVDYLHYNLKAVSLFPDPAAKEFLKDKAREVIHFAHVLQEKEQQQVKVSRLEAENRRLQQELQEAKRSQRPFTFPWSKTDFHVQIHVTGRTENCEKRFLKKVSGRLSDQNINLKVEKYREGSGHLLLVFCPVSTRVGTDMDNALEDLKGEPKVVLVMLHHKPKENTSFVDTKLQAQHPDVVCTVHARYTIQEGFYTCQMNEDAVAIVAEVLEDLCKGGKGHPAIPGAPSKSRKLH
nr:PREDICTED: uncharacterized protein LOC103281673 [Anolis carolinensis]|eukprot:XP_008121925.2 PREDICTED: uncharacterized protein LOC103281673 [Anolis carolinensis]